MLFTRPLQSTIPLPWLKTLKTEQLKHIALKTGIPLSGPKASLVKNLEAGLAECYLPSLGSGSFCHHHESDRGRRDVDMDMSILSIDMGIRNLAFAWLGCSPSSSSSSSSSSSRSSSSSSTSQHLEGKGTLQTTPTLHAWRRISLPRRPFTVPEFNAFLDTASSTSSSMPNSDVTKKSLEKEPQEEEKEDFSPTLYAQHAYTLISTLLDRYNPTHVLIERQRFRSAGGAAVQEWSLRVGVFEGMCYAVLRALGEERGKYLLQGQGQGQLAGVGVESGSISKAGAGFVPPVVLGVEPGRVGRYWVSVGSASGSLAGQGKKGGATTAREAKKLKIDLVAGWLESGEVRVSGSGEDGVRDWVDGYLGKWNSLRRTIGTGTETETGTRTKEMRGKKGKRKVDFGKLDDLADCVVQGVTWLEWQVMRERVRRDGVGAVGLDMPSR